MISPLRPQNERAALSKVIAGSVTPMEGSQKVHDFTALEGYLRRVPAMRWMLGNGTTGDGTWWVKFGIDIDHPLAWRVVQEFGHVLNLLSVEDRLPTVFKPVSPPVYLNGGPRDFLSWVIESTRADFTPAVCAEWLEGRLPRPVDDPAQWSLDDGEDDEAPES
jgi:hypothetical protein